MNKPHICTLCGGNHKEEYCSKNRYLPHYDPEYGDTDYDYGDK